MIYCNRKLSKLEEIHEALRDYQKTKNIEIRNQIIESSMGLIGSVIQYYILQTPFIEEDLFSVGIIGLIDSIESFDFSKGTVFSTWATKSITYAVKSYVSKNWKNMQHDSLEQIINDKENTLNIMAERYIEDPKVNIYMDYERQALYKAIHQIVETLPEKKKKVIKWYYGFDNHPRLKDREIGEIFGISPAAVNEEKRRARKLIEEHLIRQQWIEKPKQKIR